MTVQTGVLENGLWSMIANIEIFANNSLLRTITFGEQIGVRLNTCYDLKAGEKRVNI